LKLQLAQMGLQASGAQLWLPLPLQLALLWLWI